MAIIRSMVASNGVKIHFADDCLPKTAEENARRYAELDRVMNRIMYNWAKRQVEQMEKERKENENKSEETQPDARAGAYR